MYKYVINIRIAESTWCYQKPKGHNCPFHETIKTEEGCKLAADTLGLSYSGSVGAANYAAGCFSIQQDAFFNQIVNPSSTYPDRFLFSGGICLYRGNSIFSNVNALQNFILLELMLSYVW